jgi:acetylornithine deacetylase
VHSQFIVNGEPTDSCLATATRGVWRLRLRARGRAAHTDHERLEIAEMHRAVDAYERLVSTLIESVTPHDQRLTTQSRSSD